MDWSLEEETRFSYLWFAGSSSAIEFFCAVCPPRRLLTIDILFGGLKFKRGVFSGVEDLLCQEDVDRVSLGCIVQM